MPILTCMIKKPCKLVAVKLYYKTIIVKVHRKNVHDQSATQKYNG